MPSIRPSSELRNNYNEISEFCHNNNEPVYITKNGKGDLAVMSIEAFERMSGRFELYRQIDKGLDDLNNGRMREASEVFEDLEKMDE